MTGHLVARSVNLETVGKRGEETVHKVLSVEVLERRRKGHDALKRAREDSLSMREIKSVDEAISKAAYNKTTSVRVM